MKISGIPYFFLIFLLFSCEAKHDDQQLDKTGNVDTVAGKINAVSVEVSSLETLAAKMLASRESYLNDGKTAAEEVFIKAFIDTLKQSKTFDADFANLKKYEINVLNADDHKLRVFYWLSPYSGTMWHVQNIVQYQGENNTVTAVSFNDLYGHEDDEGSPTPFFQHIYSLNTSPQKTYLLIGYGQMSGTEPYSVSHTLIINRSEFSINKPLFKLAKEARTQLFASADLKEGQSKEKLTAQLAMIYNPQDKTISYPEVSETKNGSVFNGKRNVLTFRDGVFK